MSSLVFLAALASASIVNAAKSCGSKPGMTFEGVRRPNNEWTKQSGNCKADLCQDWVEYWANFGATGGDYDAKKKACTIFEGSGAPVPSADKQVFDCGETDSQSTPPPAPTYGSKRVGGNTPRRSLPPPSPPPEPEAEEEPVEYEYEMMPESDSEPEATPEPQPTPSKPESKPSTPPPPPPPSYTPATPAPTPPSPPPPPPPAPSSGNCGMNSVEEYLISEHNSYRSKSSRGSLSCNAAGNSVCRKWSEGQCRANKMSHDGFQARCQELGWETCAENVAWNSQGSGREMDTSMKDVMVAWWNSPGHQANMLKDEMNTVSCGYYECEDGKTYYTCMFTKL